MARPNNGMAMAPGKKREGGPMGPPFSCALLPPPRAVDYIIRMKPVGTLPSELPDL